MRIGLMIPAVNTVAEAEFHAGVPEGVSVHTARLYPGGTTAEALRRMVDEGVPRASAELELMRPDVVVFACTAAGAVLGEDGEPELVRDIATRCGAPVVSMNAAVRESLVATQATSVAVLTPYLPEVTASIAASVERAGLAVGVSAGMGINDAFEIAALTPAEVIAFAEEHLAGSEPDAILLSCGNLRTRQVRPQLAEHYGVPVVTSNHASLERALAMLASRATDRRPVADRSPAA